LSLTTPFLPSPAFLHTYTIMTRTERSQSLRALVKDRSEARNGMDSSVPKGGAGAHNWGSVDFELEYENAATYDVEDQAAGGADSQQQPKKPAVVRRASSITEEDRENALKVRKMALERNSEIDLSDIARSSVAVSCSPTRDNTITSSTF